MLRLDVREYDVVGDPNAVDGIVAEVLRQLEGELPQTDLWPVGAAGPRTTDTPPASTQAGKSRKARSA